jgi:hypothetical protein
MNKSQKFAVYGITGMLLMMTLLALLLIPMFFWGRLMSAPARIACVTILLAVVVGGFLLIKRKQSKIEVETDEMDIAIQKMAGIITSISILILIGILLIAANLLWGLNFTVPLWVLMLLYGALFFIGFIAYHIVILILYRRSSKNGE